MHQSLPPPVRSNQWHRFIQTHGGPQGFELFLVQDGKRAVWRIRLERHTDFRQARGGPCFFWGGGRRPVTPGICRHRRIFIVAPSCRWPLPDPGPEGTVRGGEASWPTNSSLRVPCIPPLCVRLPGPDPGSRGPRLSQAFDDNWSPRGPYSPPPGAGFDWLSGRQPWAGGGAGGRGAYTSVRND